MAIIAEIMVKKPSWLIELNSENKRGTNVIIITIVVFITALPVKFKDFFIANWWFSPLLILNLYELMMWIESSTIKPNIIAKINALDKLK